MAIVATYWCGWTNVDNVELSTIINRCKNIAAHWNDFQCSLQSDCRELRVLAFLKQIEHVIGKRCVEIIRITILPLSLPN